MSQYLARAYGTLATSQPWSVSMQLVGPLDLDAAGSTWYQVWATLTGSIMWSSIPASTVWTGTMVAEADATWHQGRQYKQSASVAGHSGFLAAPPEMCMVVSWLSNLSTRAGRGRWYLPGMANTHFTSEGLWVSGDIGNWATHISTAMATLTAAGLQPVLVTQHKARSVSEYSYRAITSGEITDLPGVQSRRGDKMVTTRVTL